MLKAIGKGIPTIVSQACGLEHIAGVDSIDIGDIPALREAILAVSHRLKLGLVMQSPPTRTDSRVDY